MKKRVSVYKIGYVTDRGVTIDPVHIASGPSEADAISNAGHVIEGKDKSNYFTQEEEFDGLYWIGVEGTDKELQ